jgi:hypothetical protein
MTGLTQLYMAFPVFIPNHGWAFVGARLAP